MMRRAFIDTSAFFALADQDDQRHVEAGDILRRYFAPGGLRMLTSNFVVAETHALILNRVGRLYASRFLENIYASATTIIRVAARDETRAREIIAHYRDKDFSYTDATSFASMDRLRNQWAFTFDAHFAQYGFEVLG
jgi:predicted nucleic acid-binding protein